MRRYMVIIAVYRIISTLGRGEEKISKACFWPNEVYEPCFGGCAEVTCDNPRTHLRPCYPYCEPGCVCEDPYVRDDRTHQCVLPQDCSPTQMGIPVPPKRQGKSLPPLNANIPRTHNKRSEDALEFNESEVLNNKHNDELKKSTDISRMGNYFNIVIAPPPIKTLQPRKYMSNGDVHEHLPNRQI